MSRMVTPDMFELMGGTPAEQSNNEIKQESNKAIKQEPEKVKTTFNLSLTTLEKLEDAWVQLRKKFKDKSRITKTLIVEKAIELAIKDLHDNGEYSILNKYLESNHDTK